MMVLGFYVRAAPASDPLTVIITRADDGQAGSRSDRYGRIAVLPVVFRVLKWINVNVFSWGAVAVKTVKCPTLELPYSPCG